MPMQCVVCKLNFAKGASHSFHSLPKQESNRQKWMAFIRSVKGETWSPAVKRTVICSAHFKPDDFCSSTANRVLKVDSVPTVYETENAPIVSPKKTKYKNLIRKALTERTNIDKIVSPTKKRSRAHTENFVHACSTSADPQPSSELINPFPRALFDMDELHPQKYSTITDSPLAVVCDQFSSPESPTVFNGAAFLKGEKRQGLLKLYEHQQEQVCHLEAIQPLIEGDFLRLKRLKSNVLRLQEKLLNWAINSIKDELIYSVELNSHQSFDQEFLMSDYLVMKADNRRLTSAASRREARIQNLEGQIKTLLAVVEETQERLKQAKDRACLAGETETRHAEEIKKLRLLLSEVTDDNEDLRSRLEQQIEKCAKAETLLASARKLGQQIFSSRKKLNNVQQNVRRKTRRMEKMKLTEKDHRKIVKKLRKINKIKDRKLETSASAIEDLRQKRVLCDAFANAMNELPASTQSLLNRVAQKAAGTLSNGEKYNKDIRCFALSLFHYSPAAYEYVRSAFRDCLPNKSTIQSWLAAIETEPGFGGEALAAIRARVAKSKKDGTKILASLTLDDISLKEQVEFNGEKVLGYVDVGDGAVQAEKANYAFVFMLVGLNMRLRMPCGYFFIHSMKARERAQLVKDCIEKMELEGVEIHNITFDGTSTNVAMAGELGALVDYCDNLKPSFPNPSDPTRAISVTLDASHMIKLIRNCLGDKKIIYDSEGKKIEWRYIEQLHDIQLKEGLHFANKLSTKHLEFWKSKMKVKLAAQTFSESVATAIENLDKKRHMQEFEGSEATVKFIRMVNTTFDWLNSSSKYGKRNKAPLTFENMETWQKHFEEAEDYFSSLRTGEDENSPLLVESIRRRGFVGFITCMRSARDIFDRLIATGATDLCYLLTYKLSQDHLEMFFGSIRRRNGCNTNPTCRTFKSSYKRLVVHNEIVCSANANATDQFEIFNVTSCKRKSSDELICDSNILNDDLFVSDFNTFFADSGPMINLMFEHGYASLTSSDLTRSEISEYLAGFVSKKLSCAVKCVTCSAALFGSKDDLHLYSFIESKNKGGLTIPSRSVVKLCKITEKLFREHLKPNNLNALLKLNIPLRAAMAVRELSLFEDLREHVTTDLDPLNGHINELSMAVSKTYLAIRIYHETKLENLKNGASTRSYDSRLIINKHM